MTYICTERWDKGGSRSEGVTDMGTGWRKGLGPPHPVEEKETLRGIKRPLCPAFHQAFQESVKCEELIVAFTKKFQALTRRLTRWGSGAAYLRVRNKVYNVPLYTVLCTFDGGLAVAASVLVGKIIKVI